MREKLTLDKKEILQYLKETLEEFYDIELYDLLIKSDAGKRTIYFCYYIFYHGEKCKTILPFSIENFITLLKLVVESRKHLAGTNIVVLPGEELKCRVNYRHIDFNYGRRRKK